MLYKAMYNLWFYLLGRCPGVRRWGNTRRSRAQGLYWAKCQMGGSCYLQTFI